MLTTAVKLRNKDDIDLERNSTLRRGIKRTFNKGDVAQPGQPPITYQTELITQET